MNNSSHTGRAPRSAQAAFGPYTDHRLAPMPDHEPPARKWQDVALVAVSALALVVVFAWPFYGG